MRVATLSLLSFLALPSMAQTEGTLLGGGMVINYPDFRNGTGDLGAGVFLTLERRDAVNQRFAAAPQFAYTFTEYMTRDGDVQTSATMHDAAIAVVFIADWFNAVRNEGPNLQLGPGMSYAYSAHMATQPIGMAIFGVGYRVKNTELRIRCRYGLDSMLRDKTDRMVPVHGELGLAVLL